MITCSRCQDKHDGFPPCSLYDDMFCPYDIEKLNHSRDE